MVARIAQTKMGTRPQVMPGRPVVDDGGGEVEAGQDHADADDGEADQIGVHPAAGLRLQRGVPGPPGREPAEEQGASG